MTMISIIRGNKLLQVLKTLGFFDRVNEHKKIHF